MAETGGFTLSIKYVAAVAVIVLLVVLIAIYIDKNQNATVQKTSQEVFQENLGKSKNVAIVMNITNSNSSGITTIFNCGTNLAYSLALVGKDPQNIHAYVFNESTCSDITNVSKSIPGCLNEIGDSSVFFIQYGDLGTMFKGNKAYVYINESFFFQCKVQAPKGKTN